MNILAPVSDFEHLRLVARPFALFANQFNVGEKLHLHRNRAVPLTGLAPAPGNVEGKVSRAETTLLGLGQRGEQIADGVERLNVSHGIRTRRASNRGLIDQHNFVNELVALQTFPRSGASRRAYALLLL